MEKKDRFILWFDEIGIEDVSLVGGKNASLGEMYRFLKGKVPVPNGFAITATAYNFFIERTKLKDKIAETLKRLNTKNMNSLADKGHRIRSMIRNAEIPYELRTEIIASYERLCKEYGPNADVAVRSSATAEDLPDASFAGQQESYLNIRGADDLIDACLKCFSSLFTNRAISYRADKKFDQFSIALSIVVQKMVRSDKACSGVMFTIDTESGFRDAVVINAGYGLGENIVKGFINPDQYIVFKPTLKQGFKPLISKKLGAKEMRLVYTVEGNAFTKNSSVPQEEREKFCLLDSEILTLAKWGCEIEDYYTAKKGHSVPMDIEWAKDGVSGKLCIVQARPETVVSRRDPNIIHRYVLKKRGRVIVKGASVGDRIGSGSANVIKSVHEIGKFKSGQVLVTEMTDPDWEPIMKMASAIVTNKGGRTCFTGDTLLLTNKGFITFENVFKEYETATSSLMVPSLNRNTLKIEWKPILAAMKRNGKVVEIEISQTGRMKGNTLKLTDDHKMLTFIGNQLVSKEIQEIIKDEEMLLLAQKLPQLSNSSEKERKLAYLLGAINTDGHVYTTRTHGEITFIQKPTKEKMDFIKKVNDCIFEIYNKKFKVTTKKKSTGMIRGKPCFGEANAYRLYSKQIALLFKDEQQKFIQTLLTADAKVSYNFLAGVIDGDGTYNPKISRINIYCSNDELLKEIVVACLRIGTVPQITKNRTINNVQIVEKVEDIFKYTKRVKGPFKRTRFGTRFFSAKQLFKNKNPGKFAQHINSNLLIDIEKIRKIKQFDGIINSDTRMQRVSFVQNMGFQEVYNINVADNHNYVVFTSRLTPILVNNCHAAIVSRELGIPCVVGTIDATKKIADRQPVTVSCAEGEVGYVYSGILKYSVMDINLKELPRPRTKIMMNIGNPDEAFSLSFIPNDGVGLAREEFIISSYIKVHPKALLDFKNIKDKAVKEEIEKLTQGYPDKKMFFIDKLAQGIAMIAAAFYPKDVIVRLSDFKTNEYAGLLGGSEFEPKEGNPMLGWRGASRYYDEKYKAAFALECKALVKVRREYGLTNVKVMVPFCRTVEEGQKVLEEMRKNGLERGRDNLQVYVMCEIPSNVILADEFCKIFDGFSIGSNDLTQLTLGVDRDSELVSRIYDEKNPAVKRLIESVIRTARQFNRKAGICGQAPSDFPEFAEFLVDCGIDSISLNPDTIIKTTVRIAEKEKNVSKLLMPHKI